MIGTSAFSQNLDSVVGVHTKQIVEINKEVKTVKSNVDSIKLNVDSVKSKMLAPGVKDKPCTNCELGFWEWVLVFSPFLIFAITLLIIRKRLKDFKLADALAESELTRKTIQNPEYTAANLQALRDNPAMTALLTPTIEISGDSYAKSSTRYIAFITSALTWIIVLCLTCFFLYQYIKTNEAPNLEGFSNVLLALGIGVVPYAFNKVAGAIR